MKKFLGYILVSSPYIALIVLLFLSYGMEGVITFLVPVAIFVGLVWLGAYLIENE